MELNIELKDLVLDLKPKEVASLELDLKLEDKSEPSGRVRTPEEKEAIKFVEENSNAVYSFSRMNFNCEYEYYKTYVEKDRGKNNIYGIMGGLCHDINEKYYHSEISREEAYKTFIDKFNNIGIYGANFPSEKAEQGYRENLTQYYKNIERPENLFKSRNTESDEGLLEANLKTEEFVWKIFDFKKSGIKIGTFGYADLIHYETRLINGKEEKFYIIGDFKTSSKNDYLGKKQKEKGRQLVIYAEMLNNILSGQDTMKYTHNIELYWNMLKYCNLKITYKEDKVKWLNSQKLDMLKSVANFITDGEYDEKLHGKQKKHYIEFLTNNSGWELDCIPENIISNEGIERKTIAERLEKVFGNNLGNYKNSMDLNDLPEYIKNSIEITDYYIYYDYNDESRLDLFQWMKEQYYKINEMIDMNRFEPTAVGEFYCIHLCGQKEKCEHYAKWKENQEKSTLADMQNM